MVLQRTRGQKCKHINCRFLQIAHYFYFVVIVIAHYFYFVVIVIADRYPDALIIILKAPAHLCYQLAFLSEEIEFIFANAPVTRVPEAEGEHEEDYKGLFKYNGTRKPIDGECPICVFDMEPSEEIVWCKASCGQNFHKECFEHWKTSKHGGLVTCPYCRAEWEGDSRKHLPGSLPTLKDMAPKIGSYKNIGNHPMYKQSKV